VPPQPITQLEPPAVWVWVLLWLVCEEFPALLFALLVAAWLALLAPVETSPPATFTGAFALTAFCFAFAFETASCSVFAC
jgi:hypothetical protein